jgi:hypothetical protein
MYDVISITALNDSKKKNNNTETKSKPHIPTKMEKVSMDHSLRWKKSHWPTNPIKRLYLSASINTKKKKKYSHLNQQNHYNNKYKKKNVNKFTLINSLTLKG